MAAATKVQLGDVYLPFGVFDTKTRPAVLRRGWLPLSRVSFSSIWSAARMCRVGNYKIDARMYMLWDPCRKCLLHCQVVS